MTTYYSATTSLCLIYIPRCPRFHKTKDTHTYRCLSIVCHQTSHNGTGPDLSKDRTVFISPFSILGIMKEVTMPNFIFIQFCFNEYTSLSSSAKAITTPKKSNINFTLNLRSDPEAQSDQMFPFRRTET